MVDTTPAELMKALLIYQEKYGKKEPITTEKLEQIIKENR